jgi:beta-1,4-mannooligosaccharide/beta-1,4-mannosyl-N-acetylglucosamine phosphorylase
MKRHAANPVIRREDIRSTHSSLCDVSSVFNPGGIMFQGKFLLLLRVQNRARETFLVKAISEDGIKFHVEDEPVPMQGLERFPHRIFHIYDPRITHLEGSYHVICAMDTDNGCFLGWFTTYDFHELFFQGLVSQTETRNGILFPERFGGEFLRFERPNASIMAEGVKTGSMIMASQSPDLMNWHPIGEVFHGNSHYWDEYIGSGPPPLKIEQGWLHIYHGVATHFGSANIYQAGVSLQDLHKPWLTLARGRYNILEPREQYELCGQVPNVVFPTAAIPLTSGPSGFIDLDTEIFVYYGAADTCVCLAVTTPARLLEAVYAP